MVCRFVGAYVRARTLVVTRRHRVDDMLQRGADEHWTLRTSRRDTPPRRPSRPTPALNRSPTLLLAILSQRFQPEI